VRKHEKRTSQGSNTMIKNKPKEIYHMIEKKYQKMKERLRLSMAENASERSKN
jgi:hypothetical protein